MKVTIFIGLLLAAIRIWMGFSFEPPPATWADVYKDVAHIFVGGLAVAWWYCDRNWQLNLFSFLCSLEIAVAIISRFS